MGHFGGIIGEFKKHRGLGVGISNTAATGFGGIINDLLRTDGITHNPTFVICRHLRNIGILAKPTPEIAADSGYRIRKGARQKVKQRFFFDGIHVPGNQFSINQRLQQAGFIFAHTAQAPSAVFYDTAMAAQIAFDFAPVKRLIQIGFH
jgi:hypothetical protein